MLKKSERRYALVALLEQNPFATDEQLAERFGVSVATIRLDRSALHIPEARERIRRVASDRQDDLRSLDEQELIGRLIKLELNRYAESDLTIQPVHVFRRTGIVRGHILFAQINSLATALMDADVALTAKAELRFSRPVHLGDNVRARVDVIGEHGDVVRCRAVSQVNSEIAVQGIVWVQKDPTDLGAELMDEGEAR
ncbi:transcription factor FapR [Alicyclobacillus fastidiosus]|uniref:Transcription factor FapR n=1 Tax=Alicyclobacillus fastidiosus TaxID=392011 RepID=A0ABV5AIN2_9BACL|nr:transcription factor FapR [Alicyclobacillus fastidiosus]WEH12098.1 transcription factor FapR [Alicyclobacillus fastidiosus]